MRYPAPRKRCGRKYNRTAWGPASRCVRSLGNRARQGGTDRRAERREARTSATKREIRAAGEASARLSSRPLGKRWRARLSVWCDKKSGVPWNFPFLWLGLAIDVMGALQKPRMLCRRPASIGSKGVSAKGASLDSKSGCRKSQARLNMTWIPQEGQLSGSQRRLRK